MSPSGYYAYRRRDASRRDEENGKLLEAITDIYEEKRGIYGALRIYQTLKAQGHKCSKNRVARLMQRAGLKAGTKRRFRVATDSKHSYSVSENLLDRNFRAEMPNTARVGDIAYIRTMEGWLYLATLLDLYDRKVVGWAMGIE